MGTAVAEPYSEPARTFMNEDPGIINTCSHTSPAQTSSFCSTFVPQECAEQHKVLPGIADMES